MGQFSRTHAYHRDRVLIDDLKPAESVTLNPGAGAAELPLHRLHGHKIRKRPGQPGERHPEVRASDRVKTYRMCTSEVNE